MNNFNKIFSTTISGYMLTSILVTGLCHANDITASFDRDLNRSAVTASANSLTRKNNLPVQNAVNNTVWTQEKDQIRESFTRALNNKTATQNTLGKRKVDPVATLIRKYLYNQRGNN